MNSCLDESNRRISTMILLMANAMFALAASSACNILIRYDSYELQIILLS